MKPIVVLAALLQVALGSVSITMPYPNPAGVTYVTGYQGHGAPLTYAHSAPFAQSGVPLQYNAHIQYAAPATIPAKIEAHHVGYASAQVPAVAAVPYVKHIPTVSQVPVTRYEAHPAVIEKQVDVIKPAVSTRKFEVRRPAIQKQFYDIEERVIVRPAGSALVELNEPTSKLQRGPTVVKSLPEGALPVAHQSFAYASADTQTAFAPNTIPVAHAPLHLPVSPVFSHSLIQATAAPVVVNSTPASPTASSTPSSLDQDSVVVDNADFRSAQFDNTQQFGARLNSIQQQNTQIQESQSQNAQSRNAQDESSQSRNVQVETSQSHNVQIENAQSLFQQGQIRDAIAFRQHQQQEQERFDSLLQKSRSSQENSRVISGPQVDAQSNGVSQEQLERFGPESSTVVVPSVQSSQQESIANQNKLIELLTARGGITEVGFGREGLASPSGDAGNVRARVISATPAPDNAEPTGERVSTRRIVVSRPIETLQEYDVVEPASKYERVSVQHPTFVKTAHLDHLQVHGSVPVIGKALAPAVAQTSVPIFQKTISPAYQYHY